MNKKSKIKLLLKSLFVQFGQVACDNGVTLLWDEDTELIVGYNVYVEHETEDGEIEYVAPENGEYVSGNTTFVIEDGKCVEIRNLDEVPAETEAQAETSEENFEDQPAEESETPAEEPAEEPAQEPEFNAEQAIADLRAEYDAKFEELNNKYNAVKEQLDALLALPQDENAFSKESKNDNQKPLFKTKK
jgi:hypothetical protein